MFVELQFLITWYINMKYMDFIWTANEVRFDKKKCYQMCDIACVLDRKKFIWNVSFVIFSSKTLIFPGIGTWHDIKQKII